MHCIECGIQFPEGTCKNKMRCDECRREHRRKLDRERYEQKKLDEKLREKEERAPKNSLLAIVRAAAEMNMSYGEYVSKYRV